MEPLARRIEIFGPFEAALNLTKLILFQPFDLTKWCVIGFAAFLSSLGGGGGNMFNIPSRLGNRDWSWRSTTHDMTHAANGMPAWVIPLIAVIVLLAIAIGVVLAWVGSRGRFMFTDCVVRNRGAIAEPWKEFRQEGNSLFFFRLVVGLIFVVGLGLAGSPLWLPWVMKGAAPEGVRLIVGVTLMVTFCVAMLLPYVVVSYFMVPIMYRRRCGAVQGMRESVGLIMAEPGPIILFLLFNVVLGLAIAMGACVITCLTCCIAAIPYVGTVILLPVFVFGAGFQLLFLRQFGPEYDVWAGLALAAPVAPLVQEPPPPTEPPALP